MKYYGSLQNRLEENQMFTDKIKVGTPCTEYGYTDRHAYYVSNVIDEKTIEIKKYITKRIDSNGMSDVQEYKYIENPEAKPTRLTLFKNKWHRCNVFKKQNDKYYDSIAKSRLTEKQIEKFENGETIIKRGSPISISFGVANEYYDYSF